jgi:hypothetical protein
MMQIEPGSLIERYPGFNQFSLQISNSLFKNGNLVMSSIRNKLKILDSIVRPILNTPSRVFSVLVVNHLPTMKAAANVFSHNQTMLENPAIFVSHRIEEVIRAKSYKSITMLVYRTFTFTKANSLCTRMAYLLNGTLSFNSISYPTFFPTPLASMPNITCGQKSPYVSAKTHFIRLRHIISPFVSLYSTTPRQKVKEATNG